MKPLTFTEKYLPQDLPETYHQYAYSDQMQWDAPAGAPDWVVKAWKPVHKGKLYSPFWENVTVIECNPDGGVEFLDGPMKGNVHLPSPTAGPPEVVEWNAGPTSYVKSGTYQLEKQSWSVGTLRFKRKVYTFKPESNLKLSLKKTPPMTDWGKYLKDDHYYGKSEDTQEPIYDEYHNYYTKSDTVFPTASTGTHTVGFKITDINPKVLNTLYGEAAKLDHWDGPEEKEEDEPSLWELI